MKVIEKVNPAVCKKLSTMAISDFIDLYEESPDQDTIMVKYNNIKKYCELQNSKGHSLEREYIYAKGKTNGRLFVDGPGIQRIWSKFRGVLCDGIYTDFDMVNAHPCILSYLCKKYKISCSTLDTYIINREEKLNALMNSNNIKRSDAKSLFLEVMNDNKMRTKIGNKIIKDEFFKAFDKEMKDIQKAIYNKFKTVYRVKNSDDNKEGKVLNHLLCDTENKILHKIINVVNDNKIGNIGALMFDGLMIEKVNDVANTIKIFNKTTKQYGILWSIKDHDTELLDTINEFKADNKISYIGQDIVDVTEHMLDTIFKDKMFRCNGSLFFQNGVWFDNQKEISYILTNIISDQDLYIEYNGKPMKISKIMHYIDDMIKLLYSKCPINNRFMDEMHDKSYNHIQYNNGYYDMGTNVFHKNKYTETTIKIDRNYDDSESNKAVRQEIYAKILNPIFGINSEKDTDQMQTRDYCLHIIARAIAGNVQDKNWFIFEGLRNSGKGVLTDLLIECFHDYIGITNSDNFIVKKKSSDAAKQLSWVVANRFARILLCQEISKGDTVMDGTMIKKIASGGDKIEARINNKDEIKFKIQGTLFMCCNDIPIAQPTDCMETCNVINMKSVFVANNYPDSKKLEGFNYYKADPTIKRLLLRRDDVIHEFTRIIYEAYHVPIEYPEFMRQQNDSLNDDDNDEIEKLINLFEMTRKSEDKIDNKTLKMIVNCNNIDMSLKKAKTILQGKGAKHYRDTSSRGLSGLKEINDDDDE